MKDILNFIPGFRSRKTWKMIVATLYYLSSLTAITDSFGLFLAMISFPFVAFGIRGLIKNRSKRSLLNFVIPLIIFAVGGAIISPTQDMESPDPKIAITDNDIDIDIDIELSKEQGGEETSQSTEEHQNIVPTASEASSANQNDYQENTEEELLETTEFDSENDGRIDSPISLMAATVTRHVDGDTVYVTLENGQEYKMRFIGVDTPETVHPSKPVEFYGKEASDYTKSKLLNQTVYLEKDVSDTDRYNRLLRYIWLEPPTEINKEEIKSKMFNAILVANGYAQVSTYPPDVKYQEYFVEFAKDAREQELGLWAEEKEVEQTQVTTSTPTNSSTDTNIPREESNTGNNFAEKSDTDKDYTYMGNKNSKKFHYTTCSSAKQTSEHNRVYIATREEAINSGYVPCKRCNP